MKRFINKSLFIIDLTLIYFNCYDLINCSNIDTDFPLVFKPTFDENIENYFGLTVDMQKVRDETNFIIGAPKANSTLYSVKESGTVFRCELLDNITTNCKEIDLGFRRTDVRNRRQQIAARDEMFLGGTILSRPNSAQVLICAPKWSQELYLNRPDHQINPSGSCFVLDLELQYQSPIEILPLTDTNLQFYDNTYYYSHSMTGFSATFTQNGDHLLLGAPGFYQWRGTILETQDLSFGSASLLKEQFLIHQTNRFQSEAYAGYSLVNGYFLAGIRNSIAVGAPRDLNYRGRVYVYNLSNGRHSEQTTSMFRYIDGTQMGEYFGSSLLSIDINSDQFSDLLIGSPFYSSQDAGDCGRVYIFLSNGKGFNSPKILSGSESSGARFGTSIANLGDINLDGYNDIAIGAPYEDERGVVYIYYGTRNGILTPFAQRISARDNFNQINLEGFGISISSNRDVDKNFYNDILIGSYLSNKAVLLRTKPIVNIKAAIILNSTQINVNDKNCEYIDPKSRIRVLVPCVGMTYCIEYNGAYVPSSLNLNLMIRFDSRRPENPRCFTFYKNQLKTEIIKTLTLSAYSSQTCFDQFVVYLKNKTTIDDIFTPIEFSLSYSLLQLEPKHTFCSKCPIIANNMKITNQLHFQTGCRVDEKCVSNLKLFTKTLLNNALISRSDSILEGFHKNLTLSTTVQNRAEPSYLSKLMINTIPKLNLLKQDSSCRLPQLSSQNNTKHYLIECDVGNPLKMNTQQKVDIPFDISQLDLDLDKIVFNIELKTASEVTKDSVMNETVVLNVVRNASLEMFGSSIKSEEIYESQEKRKSNLIPFSGIFQIVKQNWSSVENVLIEIQFPSLFNKQPLLYRPYVEIIRGVSVNCNQTISSLPLIPNKNPIESLVSKQQMSIDLTENDKQSGDRKTLTLECNSHISCLKMECFAGPFTSDKQIAQFVINSALNLKNIESIFGKKYDSIKLITKSKATILDQRIASNSVTISTNFLFKRIVLSKESIDKWIIIVSVIAGLLILLLIIIILVKLGFFRRKKLLMDALNEENKSSQINSKVERNSLLDSDESGYENNLQNIDLR